MNAANMNVPAGKDKPGKVVSQVKLLPPLPRKKRVAAYARVSTDKDASLHSLAAQVSYYSGLIQSRKDWEYAGVYADEGISGTRANRPEFQRLLRDCRAGKIDIVLVKSISRFARNTLTSLQTVRELKTLGIDVFFEREGIHSLTAEGELLFTITAACAQAEAESVSENCRWRIRKNFAEGIPVTNRIYGFKMKHGQFTVVPEEAEVIREIFAMYLDGLGRTLIAMRLNERGIPAPDGGQWLPSRLYDILQNEKYAGDLLMQKYYVKDCLSKKTLKNRGERKQFFIENNHESIIPHIIFERAQDEIACRAAKYSPQKNGAGDADDMEILKRPDGKYLFTGKITCGVCGRSFCRKKANAGTAYARAAWVCSSYGAAGRKGCVSRRVLENVLVPIAAGLLDIAEEDLPIAVERVQGMTIYPDGRIEAVIDGKSCTAAWANASRRSSWDEAARKRASEQMQAVWERRKG